MPYLTSLPLSLSLSHTLPIYSMQLRTGGDPDFVDLYAEVPWMEFKASAHRPPCFFLVVCALKIQKKTDETLPRFAFLYGNHRSV